MKRKFTIYSATACTLVSLLLGILSCQKDGLDSSASSVTPAPSEQEVTENLFLKDASREEIQSWAKAHIDSLAAVAWKSVLATDTRNTRDPDQNREVFRNTGYDGRNVFQYLLGGDVVDAAILDSLIVKAKKEGNKKVVAVAGHSGGGKSTAIKNVPAVKAITNEAGIVLDEVWTNRENLKALLEKYMELVRCSHF